MLCAVNSYPASANQFVVYVGMGLDFHQTFSRQILRVKGCVAFAGWLYAATNQITNLMTKVLQNNIISNLTIYSKKFTFTI